MTYLNYLKDVRREIVERSMFNPDKVCCLCGVNVTIWEKWNYEYIDQRDFNDFCYRKLLERIEQERSAILLIRPLWNNPVYGDPEPSETNGSYFWHPLDHDSRLLMIQDIINEQCLEINQIKVKLQYAFRCLKNKLRFRSRKERFQHS